MAQEERRREDRQDARSRQREQKRQQRRRARSQVDVDDFPASEFMITLRAAIAVDGALRVGVTRDGGAWAIGVYGLGEPFTEHANSGQMLADLFEELQVEFLAGLKGGDGGDEGA